jgi:hypothetical protein
MEASNSKIGRKQQEEDSNLLSSPKIHEGSPYRMPHMIKLFEDSSID